ncbi:hypothetical protein BV25DRAFT_1832321, partial [Artomyces pyxidatus]
MRCLLSSLAAAPAFAAPRQRLRGPMRASAEAGRTFIRTETNQTLPIRWTDPHAALVTGLLSNDGGHRRASTAAIQGAN